MSDARLSGNFQPVPHRRGRSLVNSGGLILSLMLAPLLPGCSTPDLKPFAAASRTVSVSVTTGGELALKPLAKTPLWVNDNLVEPGDPAHPYTALAASWSERRKVMDAVLVYSTALAAISDASAHRQENATALLGSVQQLAAAVPGYGAAFNSAGTLVVQGLELTVEVKAWHDLRRAIASAEPAIQLVARGIKLDFAEIARLYEAPLNDQLAKLGASIRPVVRIEQALKHQREAQRQLVAADPGDSTKGAELLRLDGLYATALGELTQIRSARASVEDERARGKEFFASAIRAVEAWAAANAELVTAFREQRLPNFTLLVVRAEELKETVNQLKTQ